MDVTIFRVVRHFAICRDFEAPFSGSRIDGPAQIDGLRPAIPTRVREPAGHENVEAAKPSVALGREVQRLHVWMQEWRALGIGGVDRGAQQFRGENASVTIHLGHVQIDVVRVVIAGRKQVGLLGAHQLRIRVPPTDVQFGHGLKGFPTRQASDTFGDFATHKSNQLRAVTGNVQRRLVSKKRVELFHGFRL